MYKRKPAILIILCAIGLVGLGGITGAHAQTPVDPAVRALTFDKLAQHIESHQGEVVVLNFWATWCKPCVAELPYFEQLNTEMASQGVHVILASTDFQSEYENRVIPFVKKKALTSTVILIDESNPNDWIDRVEPNWSGVIPATAIYNRTGQMVHFVPQGLTYDELMALVKPLL
jgi:thiol-disulfide isomerase/thioredoxin